MKLTSAWCNFEELSSPVAAATVVTMPCKATIVPVAESMPVNVVTVPSTTASIIQAETELYGRAHIDGCVVNRRWHDIAWRHGIWIAVVWGGVIGGIGLVIRRDDRAAGKRGSEDGKSE
jgi:hypothetical protein